MLTAVVRDLHRPEALCVDVVGRLPRCMDMITAAEVIRRVDLYFYGNLLRYLPPAAAVPIEDVEYGRTAQTW